MGRLVGSSLGALLPFPAAARLGGEAGAYLGKITGLGDYKISHNTLTTDQGPPLFGNQRSVRIQHREFVGFVTSSVLFRNDSYQLNPGNTVTFPWLSGVARNFEEYSFHGAVMEYKATSATAIGSTNTSLGVVVLSTNYNVKESLYDSRVAAEQAIFTVSTVPSSSAIHPIECAPNRTVLERRFVQQGVETDNEDLRFQDWGNFQVITEGQQLADVELGELWVSYDVVLYKPRHDATPGGVAHYALASFANDQMLDNPTAYTNNDFEVDVLTNNTFRVQQAGCYLLIAAAHAATSVTFTGAFGLTGGVASIDPWWWHDTSAHTTIGSGTDTACVMHAVQITNPADNILRCPWVTCVGSPTGDLVVMRITPQLYASARTIKAKRPIKRMNPFLRCGPPEPPQEAPRDPPPERKHSTPSPEMPGWQRVPTRAL